ncbi:MAG TPA: hypothetical protein VNX29_18110 [Kaistia sp.]|nr:hypothetical protein [Kaistia sp.]
MAQSGDFQEAAEKIGATASAVSAHARRAARAATSEAARAVRGEREVVRNVFHDLADEAEEKARSAGEASTAFGRMLARRSAQQPLVAIALVAATAALASALAGWAFTRR